MKSLPQRVTLPIVVAVSIMCLFAACETEPFDVDKSNGNTVNRKLKVVATDFYQVQGVLKDSLLPDVRVYLYRTEEDRNYNQDLAREGITDSNGLVEFQYVKDTMLYIKAQNMQLDSVLEEVRIPPQANTTWLYLDFL